MHDLVVRENIAVANVVVLAFLTFVLLRNVWGKYRWLRGQGRGFLALWEDPLTQGAIALSIMNGGDAIYRIWVWLLLRVYNDGSPSHWVREQWPLAMLASIMIVLGALCAIRVFSPRSWGHCGWLSCLALLVVVLVVNILT